MAKAGDTELIRQLRQVVREEASFHNLRKNGDTWKGWLSKIVTPDRVLWLLMAIFVLGQRAQQYTADLSTAVREVKEQAEVISTVQGELQQFNGLMTRFEDQLKTAKTEAATRADVARIEQAQSAAITRGEFQSILRQQILPRLDRIEKEIRTSQ